MKFIFTISFGLSVFAFAACSTTPPANEAQPQNTAANQANASQPAPQPAEPTVGPAAVLRALHEASKADDIPAIKTYLSASTIDRLERGAAEAKINADELLKDESPFEILPELGRENISGDTATVEVRNLDTGEFENMPFVKENGKWKVALDEYIDNLAAEADDEPAKP